LTQQAPAVLLWRLHTILRGATAVITEKKQARLRLAGLLHNILFSLKQIIFSVVFFYRVEKTAAARYNLPEERQSA
jgi:hypothetical protein